MPGPLRTDWPPTGANMLLQLLPDGERTRLEASMHRIPINAHDVLQRPGEAMRHIYFPLRGVISLMTPLEDGSSVETATVGNEGMVGIYALFGGGGIDNAQAIGQVPGEALRMEADHLRAEVDGDGKFREVLLAYAQALMAQISQSVACNGSHSIQYRCARWLLQAHDRAGEDQFLLTQEFLADMLAVRRPSVTLAARKLQQAGLIEYERGRITIKDRPGLEKAACECYAVIKGIYGRVVGVA